jgi:hypothetical protein
MNYEQQLKETLAQVLNFSMNMPPAWDDTEPQVVEWRQQQAQLDTIINCIKGLIETCPCNGKK